MTPTRVRTLLLTALVCGVASWLLLRVVYASLPPLPWTGVPALLVLAVGEGWTGHLVRVRLRGGRPGVKPVAPLAVARLAVFAKASALAGALIGGLAAGFLVYVSESLDKPAFEADAYVSGATLGSAIALILAALYLEYGCRVPPERGGRRDEHPDEAGPPPWHH